VKVIVSFESHRKCTRAIIAFAVVTIDVIVVAMSKLANPKRMELEDRKVYTST